MTADYTFFSSSHGKLTKNRPNSGNKAHFNKFKRTEIIQGLLLDHNGIKLEISNRKLENHKREHVCQGVWISPFSSRPQSQKFLDLGQQQDQKCALSKQCCNTWIIEEKGNRSKEKDETRDSRQEAEKDLKQSRNHRCKSMQCTSSAHLLQLSLQLHLSLGHEHHLTGILQQTLAVCSASIFPHCTAAILPCQKSHLCSASFSGFPLQPKWNPSSHWGWQEQVSGICPSLRFPYLHHLPPALFAFCSSRYGAHFH